jgi:RimJ/RimL family protein N-acetyltransferase
MLIPLIETARLRIRQFDKQDWPAVYAYTSNADLMTYIPEGPMSQEQAISFVTGNSGEQAEAFPVFLKSENRLIGHIVFHLWFAPQTYEVGWIFHPAYHGNGYATEAARAMLCYSFEVLAGHRVIATCQPENPASYRVMEKLGMRREAHFRKCIYRDENLWWDEYFYALLDEEWFSHKD